MKKLIIILFFCILSCGQSAKDKVIDGEESEKPESKTSNLSQIGEKIQDNFKGHGKIYVAIAVKIKEGQGNPVEDGIPDEYEIQFSGNLEAIKAGCCYIRLINEGDLNSDGTDEISLFQSPMNGCTYSMTTYSFLNGNWKKLFNSFLIPTACEQINDEDLQKRIYKEDKCVYFLDTDPNDESGELLKKRVVANLKQNN